MYDRAMFAGYRVLAVAAPRAIVGLIAALALAGCGSTLSSTPTRLERQFVARVDSDCSRANIAVASIPVVLGGLDPLATLRRQAALVTSEARQLAALHAPPSLTPSYGSLTANMRGVAGDTQRLLDALAARNATAARTASTTLLAATERTGVQAYEAGFIPCGTDVESTHFVAKSARERLGAQLDRICAPLVSDYVNFGVRAKALLYEERTHRRKSADARRLAVDGLIGLARGGVSAVTEARALSLSAADRRRAAPFVAGLERLSGVIGNEAAHLKQGLVGPASATTTLKEIGRRVGLAAVPTGANECVAL